MQAWTPEQKAGAIREHLSDPEVADKVFDAAEPEDRVPASRARMFAGNAISRHDGQAQERAADRQRKEAVATGRTDAGAYTRWRP